MKTPRPRRTQALLAGPLLSLLLVTSLAGAEPAAPVPEAKTPAPAARFVLPFQLRPMIAKTLVRSDAIASTHVGGSTVATVTTLSYRFLPDLAVLARLPYVINHPKAGPNGSALGNPLVGGLFTPSLRPTTRAALFGGIAFPLGQGGGDHPDRGKATAEGAGIYGRAALDNALWVADYGVVTAGVGLAEARGPCTGQVETTVLHLVRLRAEATQKDSSRTNLTAGLMVGCYAASPVQLIGELRYQRWLSTPVVVDADASKRDQATAAVGLRFDVRAGAAVFRPGLLIATPIDDPMKKGDYRQVMFDLPVVF